MKTNHIQMLDKVYCHNLLKTAIMTTKFFYDNCKTCPYFNGVAQGDGIECLFDDKSNEPFITIWDPEGWQQENFENLKPAGILE